MSNNPILISNPTNIRYLTGFSGLSPTEREAYVLLTDTQTYLFTSSLYREEAMKCKVQNEKCKIIEISKEHPLSKSLASICEKEEIQKLDVEETDLRVTEYETLKNALTRTTLIHSKNRIEDMRRCKKKYEIDAIKQASILTDECFSAMLKLLVPGVFESEIALIIESFFRRQGAGIAFSPIVAFGKNTSKPHYAAEEKGAQLNENDIVLLDFGARVNGYCSDMTRMVFVGAPENEIKRAYVSLQTAQQHAIELLKSGERAGSVLDTKTRELLEKDRYPTYPHSLGHALGLDIHESPRLYKDDTSTLIPGMVFTIEPGIYIEGSFGMRIEDTILITDSGIEQLTRSTNDIFVVQ